MTETQQTHVIVGMAGSGRAAAELAVAQGHRVIGMDIRTDIEPLEGVELLLGTHDRRVLLNADQIIVSPGVPINQADLVAAREAGVPMVGELGYAWRHVDLPTIAITGTNGKSTVTSFVGQILKRAGRKPFVGGNLGTPLSCAVGGDYDVAVVEVSSYQLEMPGDFAPQVAAILNLTPDHLGRHGTMEAYAATKCEVLRGIPPNGLALLPAGHALLTRAAGAVFDGPSLWLGARPGVVRAGRRVLVDMGMQTWHFELGEFSVQGDHNLDNIATAIALCLAMGVKARTVQETLSSIEGLAHRMEVVSDEEDVLWINDSKATNVAAALVGVTGLARKAVVLLGGEAKGPGFNVLEGALGRHLGVIAFGGSGPAIADELSGCGIECVLVDTMETAVERAREWVEPGGAVLLSPGCASFDAFKNFEHRGDVFRALVTGGKSS